MKLFGKTFEDFANRATRARYLTSLLAVMAFMSPLFTFADEGDMQVFDKTESIEFSAVARHMEARQSESGVEVVPINQNTFLMQVFDKIESIEFAAVARQKEARQSESFVEVVPINQNTFLSAEWTMKKISEFYSQHSGSCRSYDEETITCSRDVYTVDGKFRVIITFQESLELIPVVEHVAIGVK